MTLFFLHSYAVYGELPQITITEKTNPKIVELYQRLQNAQSKIDEIQSERMDKLSENYKALKENEQSTANKTLTALTTAATGIGGMELARGLAEQQADKEAEQDMAAYIASMRCTYGDGKQVKAGPDEIELPGANDETLMKLRSEYFALAKDLKQRKEALGMAPGIESEEIMDKSQMGLYDDENIGISSGAYASLYRAKALESEEDQTNIDKEKKSSKTRVIAGGVAAGVGTVGGIVGNAIINKDAPKNESDKIQREYDNKLKEAKAEQEDLEKQLNEAIAQNSTEVKEFNAKLQQHKDQIANIKQAQKDCQNLFDEYIEKVSALSPVENETDSVPDVELPDVAEQQNLLSKCTECAEKDGKCVKETTVTDTNIQGESAAEQQTVPVVESEQPQINADVNAIVNALKETAEELLNTTGGRGAQ